MVVEASQPLPARLRVQASSNPYHAALSGHDPTVGLAVPYANTSVRAAPTSPSLEECMSAWGSPALTLPCAATFACNFSVVKPDQVPFQVMGVDAHSRSDPDWTGP
jgi:hypothetical protein